MSERTKTTVYLDAESYEALRRIAERRDLPAAELVREAVAEYVAKEPRLLPRSLGIGRSGRKDLGSRAEELLDGFGEI